ncbi:MAG: sigma-70 family RNA polymerase sigma factor [Patescibacteria group bacterium]|nr:sigma-70 family RNA polymerase sigma factor [Patescibacteria group bacterium]MDD5716088.1 sigma-70 family RNA polymerase sigma factor [Patescibacteria group bacterium]
MTSDDWSLDVYLREIGTTPLIDAAEEARCAVRIRQGDKIAFEKLVKANLRFVVSVAKQYQNQGLSLADLINEGNIGLMKAAKRFDETRGFKFISYAVWWIKQAILQALAEQGHVVRLPQNRVGILHKVGKASAKLEQDLGRQPLPEEIAFELRISDLDVEETEILAMTHLSLDAPFEAGGGNSLLDVLEMEQAVSPESELDLATLRVDLEKALDTLTAREAEVISLYYGLDHEKALTLEEIGARFALTRERIRQIKEKAMRRLKHASRSRALRRYLQS